MAIMIEAARQKISKIMLESEEARVRQIQTNVVNSILVCLLKQNISTMVNFSVPFWNNRSTHTKINTYIYSSEMIKIK